MDGEQTTARSAERVNWKSGHTQLCANQRCLSFGPSARKVLRPRRTCLGPINPVGSASDRTRPTAMGRRVQFRWFCASDDSCKPRVHEKSQNARDAGQPARVRRAPAAFGLDCSAWSSKLLTENAGSKIECTVGGMSDGGVLVFLSSSIDRHCAERVRPSHWAV